MPYSVVTVQQACSTEMVKMPSGPDSGYLPTVCMPSGPNPCLPTVYIYIYIYIYIQCIYMPSGPDPCLPTVVVVRLEHSHSFIDSFDNHYTASGPASCRRRRPPGNAVSGHSSTMCLVVWWLSPQGHTGDVITPLR